MLKPTNKSYLIALDCRSRLAQSRCWQCRYLTAEEAAHVIIKTITSAESEENVTVVGFGEKGILFPISIKKGLKLKDYSSVLKEVSHTIVFITCLLFRATLVKACFMEIHCSY